MKWSFSIGRVRGTIIRIHATLLLFFAWFAWQGWRMDGGQGALEQFVFIALLFLSVLLHEFGHITAARHYDIPTPDVLLTPIGGIARIARMPEEPRQELVIALAGPAVTLVIALALGSAVVLASGSEALFPSSLERISILVALTWTNVILLLFNLLPAFPMDGGRVLRALLAGRMGMLKGTRIAARVGQALAVGLFVIGLQGNIILVLIAGFVFLGAEAEYGAVRRREGGAAIGPLAGSAPIIDPTTPVGVALDLQQRSGSRTLPVVAHDRRLLGTVSEGDLLNGLATGGQATPVSEAMVAVDPARTVIAGTTSPAALAAIPNGTRDDLPIVDTAGRYLGMLTPEKLAEVVRAAGIRGRGTG